MPKRNEEKVPEVLPRVETQPEWNTLLLKPEKDEKNTFYDPVTRNHRESNLNETGVDILMDGTYLTNACRSQGGILNESADFIDSMCQQYSNVRMGIDGKFLELLTVYNVKQSITKTVKGAEPKKQLLGSKQE